jgi:hypothetical protein
MAGGEGREVRVPGQLTAFGAEPTRAMVTVADMSPTARARRGAIALGACWTAAAAAVFLPILHFVLVPGLLGAGVAAAIVVGRQARRVTDIRGACPRCLTEQAFEAGGRVRPTRGTTCPGCHANVILVLGVGAADEAGPEGAGTIC